jgi:cyclophilin family peptidyl-prolyl cis-trans isomerase
MSLITRRLILGAAGALALPGVARAQTAATAIFELKDGPVTIQLLPELAPRHVERIRTLISQGLYDGTPFHRVIEGFMAQGGDPTGTGTGGFRDRGFPDLPAEFVPASRARFLRGTCGMARSQNPNSANSQFFIMFAPAPGLDGQYTIWGRVTAGMDAVDKIKRGVGQGGVVPAPVDRLIRARLGA